MKPTPTARLHVILAREAPLAGVIRRGPAKQVCTVLWNRRTDEFTLGKWCTAGQVMRSSARIAALNRPGEGNWLRMAHG